MMRVGWITDIGSWGNGRVGGAEMNAEGLAAAAPADVQILRGRPDYIPADVDVYVVHNCVQYDHTLIEAIKDKPVYKMTHDVWSEGNAVLRQWLLNEARANILVSPKLREWLKWTITTPVHYVPSLIDGGEVVPGVRKQRAVWLGRLHPQKGLSNAIRYAEDHNIRLDVYGFGDLDLIRKPAVYCGVLEPEDVMRTLAQYETFIFLPQDYDACPRVVFEAWRAGCKIITNGWQGASWWLTHDPAAIDNAGQLFWGAIING